jgi:hypothetical protein
LTQFSIIVVEAIPTLSRQAGLATISELVNDVDAILLGPLSNLLLLDGNGVLLPILRRMAVVGDAAEAGYVGFGRSTCRGRRFLESHSSMLFRSMKTLLGHQHLHRWRSADRFDGARTPNVALGRAKAGRICVHSPCKMPTQRPSSIRP